MPTNRRGLAFPALSPDHRRDALFGVPTQLAVVRHTCRAPQGVAPPHGVGWGKGELFVPHMTLRRPLWRNIDGHYGYTSHPFTSPLPAVTTLSD